jgi:hypothetical protein
VGRALFSRLQVLQDDVGQLLAQLKHGFFIIETTMNCWLLVLKAITVRVNN